MRQDVDEWLEIVPGEDGVANKGFLSKKKDPAVFMQDSHSMVVLKVSSQTLHALVCTLMWST